MSTPRTLALAREVKAASTTTERGDFATLVCEPRDAALPRGNALLIPGFTGSKEDFASLLPLLAQAGWSVATYDQRGQYETPARPTDDFSLHAFGADAVAVSAALFGSDERVHLVGHSFGGLVAAAAALASPGTWASLTLMCSGPGRLSGSERDDAQEAAEAIRERGLEEVYARKVERDAGRGMAVPDPDVADFLHRRFLANSADSLAAIADHLASAVDRSGELATLDLPVSVMRGRDDDAWPHDVQARLADALGTRVVVVSGAAHTPAVENPEETRDALARIWLG